MAQKDEKYGDNEEQLTQVRSIIKHLNEDKPAQERAREVVVRADGSKVVRVTKKRRVMMTSADVRRRSRRHILWMLLAVFLLLSACGGFLFYRVTTMSSAAYLSAQQTELARAWGAESVQVEGAGIDGLSMRVNSVVADFPVDSMLERVELSGIHAELSVSTFYTGCLIGENLEIERAVLVLRDGTRMQMPMQVGKNIWDFRRMECKDFSIQFAGGDAAPMQVKNTQAYMYYPNHARSSSVVMFRGGSLCISGWKTVKIAEGKVHVSAKGVDDFSIQGTTDAVTNEAEQRRTSIAFGGKILHESELTGPFCVESSNMRLADFTKGRFEEFLTARTVAVSHGKLKDTATMKLVGNGEAPVFEGEFHLKNICLSSFPALMSIQEHIEPAKRGQYNPISLHRGYVRLAADGETQSVEIPAGAMEERDLAALRGKIVLNSANELSGEMSYSIPVVLARVEYSDGHPDPIFQSVGEWAVLNTHIKGMGNRPADDMAEIEARAEVARRSRPERIPFDKLNVNQLTDQLLKQQAPASSESPVSPDTPAPIESTVPVQPATAPLNSLDNLQTTNPFEVSEDPFAPATPF